MALLLWCPCSSFLPLQTPQSWRQVELPALLCGGLRPTRKNSWEMDVRIAFAKQKVDFPGSLPDIRYGWMANILGINKAARTFGGRGRQPNALEVTHADEGALSNDEEGLIDCPIQSFDNTTFHTFALALKQCGKAKALSDGKHVHAQISRYGYHRSAFLGNCLIQMYGRCGSVEDAQEAFEQICDPNLRSWNLLMKAYVQNGQLDDARSIFSKMPRRDVVSWSAMIAACAQNGYGKEAVDLFYQMQSDGVRPNRITFLCVLDACLNSAALEKGRMIHAAIVDRGYEQDVVVGTALVNMYGKCSFLDNARRAFDRLFQRDVVAWNSMIAACAQNGNGCEALSLFDQMQAKGVMPTKITFVCMLDACTSAEDLAKGHEINSAIIENGFEKDIVVGSALVKMYGKCRSLFAQMPQRNVVSWNVMIEACTKNGYGKEAVKLFHQMELDDVRPDKISFVSALDACTSMTALKEGQQIHSAIVDNNYEDDAIIGSALINMYGKCGNLPEARKAFDRLHQKNIISWSAMMVACAQNGYGKGALDLFHQMQLEGYESDKVSFICALEACTSVAAPKEGKKIHVELVNRGYEQDMVVVTALINMYGKCGILDDARSAFARMPQQDVVCWNAIIAACAQNGHGKEALMFFHQMRLEGFKPDRVTFVCVLTACNHTGNVHDGRRYFLSMCQDYGITHTVDHYMCMVDLLGRAGHLDEAEKLINTMPFEKTASAWSSLLGACKIHGDSHRAVHIANQYSKTDPKDGAPYVMLSNIYSDVEYAKGFVQ